MHRCAAATPAAVQRVWDPLVRLAHWTLVASTAISALGLLERFEPYGLHRPAGWVAMAAVVLRLGWGFIGPGHARFARFASGPRPTLRFLRLVIVGRAPRYLGHNPLGAWMVFALMACVSGLAFTGWLYTTDAFWGDETVEQLHGLLAWALLGLVTLHVAGVVVTGREHRENLVRAMFDGRKRKAAGDDIG